MMKIKPCPFCGSKLFPVKHADGGFTLEARHNPSCPISCMEWVERFTSEEAAIKAWNRRTENCRMSKYIDVEELKKLDFDKIFGYEASYEICLGVEAVLMVAEKMPTADVQEVVRCKDCVHFCQYEVVEDFDGRCTARGGETDKDDFCNYGKKVGNEDAE